MIRQANRSDLPFVISLSRDAFSRYGKYKSIVTKWYFTPGVYTFVFEKENKDKTPRGFVMLGLMRDHTDGETILEVIAIAVAEAYQKKGIGTGLIEFAKRFNESLAAQESAFKIRLSVAETNRSGQDFFQKRGFKVIAEASWRYPAGQKALRMEFLPPRLRRRVYDEAET
jgi:ribosomal protein S18 acetylase RimI-like enzyme